MPPLQDDNSDTIRILVSTDNHVGYEERDPIRKNDSANSFNEVLEIAKERDVDMVLLAGDLFHENKPSRQSLYQVIRSLRINCLGPKPCELEILSDQTEAFEGYFNHVNYEDPDINVAIPVFSIHGNHDDPTGDGHLAALDILHESGLVNYYGRIRDSATIDVRPVLIQKGRTKLALYGMSNVRDERLFHTFKEGNVTFHQPTQNTDDWFNLLSVHQNRHEYTPTSYLDEKILPNSMDLVIWGHEHECLIEPSYVQETGFSIIQPGSTVATSLVPGEAKPKMVTILSITGKDFEHEPIPLKTVRPFKYKDIVLKSDAVAQNLAQKVGNRDAISTRLKAIIEEMIQEAETEWLELNTQDGNAAGIKIPEPLIRLRVDYSPPDKGSFDCENPRRLSNAFQGRVANQNDVVYFWKKKKRSTRRDKMNVPKNLSVAEQLSSAGLDTVVQQYLSLNPLSILPSNHFGEAIYNFVDKDEKAALDTFVGDQHDKQRSALLDLDNSVEDIALDEAIENHRDIQAKNFVPGANISTKARPAKKPPTANRPRDWDSDENGPWADAANNGDQDDDAVSITSHTSVPSRTTRGRGRGRGRGAASASSRASAAKKKAKTTTARASTSKAKASTIKKQGTLDFTNGTRRGGRQAPVEDDDIEMLDDGDEEGLFVTQPSVSVPSRGSRATSTSKATTTTSAAPRRPVRAAVTSQRLRTGVGQSAPFVELSDDIDDSSDDDEEDAFEPVTVSKANGRR